MLQLRLLPSTLGSLLYQFHFEPIWLTICKPSLSIGIVARTYGHLTLRIGGSISAARLNSSMFLRSLGIQGSLGLSKAPATSPPPSSVFVQLVRAHLQCGRARAATTAGALDLPVP